MKQIAIILLVLFLVNKSFSQMGLGQPVSFSSLAGGTYNPGTHNGNNSNKWVTDRSNDELSPSEIANYHSLFDATHPGHIILGEATTTYNCQGYYFTPTIVELLIPMTGFTVLPLSMVRAHTILTTMIKRALFHARGVSSPQPCFKTPRGLELQLR